MLGKRSRGEEDEEDREGHTHTHRVRDGLKRNHSGAALQRLLRLMKNIGLARRQDGNEGW